MSEIKCFDWFNSENGADNPESSCDYFVSLSVYDRDYSTAKHRLGEAVVFNVCWEGVTVQSHPAAAA